MKEEIKNILAAILGLFLIVLTISAVISIKEKLQETENKITVLGVGIVYTEPELALASFSVISEAKTVAEAMSENAEKMNKVVDFMKEQGIEEKDLKTANFNIYPRYEWYDEENQIFSSGGKRVLVGYELTQTLEVKIRDMEKIGAIIEGGASAGANQIGDLQFTLDDEKQEELKKQAREEAIDKAKSKAKELAEQLGVRLVKISNFSESSLVPYFYPMKESVAGMGGADSASVPQIQTGENKVEVQVSITYEIK